MFTSAIRSRDRSHAELKPADVADRGDAEPCATDQPVGGNAGLVRAWLDPDEHELAMRVAGRARNNGAVAGEDDGLERHRTRGRERRDPRETSGHDAGIAGARRIAERLDGSVAARHRFL